MSGLGDSRTSDVEIRRRDKQTTLDFCGKSVKFNFLKVRNFEANERYRLYVTETNTYRAFLPFNTPMPD